jgi:hypothetical protein
VTLNRVVDIVVGFLVGKTKVLRKLKFRVIWCYILGYRLTNCEQMERSKTTKATGKQQKIKGEEERKVAEGACPGNC